MGVAAVKVRGPFRGPTGYEHHVREFVRELHRQGVAIQLEHVSDWYSDGLPERLLDPWYETLTEPVPAQVALHFCMPHQVRRHRDLIDVNFTMFEAARISPLWVQLSHVIDWTVVPNEFSRRAWIDSGAPENRIRVCPLGVRSDLFAGEHDPWPIELPNGKPFGSYRARFINVSAWNQRKNVGGLIRNWIMATNATDDAALVLKTGMDPDSQKRVIPRLLENCERAARKRLEEAAPLQFVFDVLTDDEMPRFYAAGTHYFSQSHGEGWDLPMMEAIGAGLVPIAPDHSAYQTYLDPSIALMIPSRETLAVPPGTLDWFDGLNWWIPDEQASIEVIRGILDEGLSPPASGRDRILGQFTWERATRSLLQILLDAESISPFT